MELARAFEVLGVPRETAVVRCWDPYQQRRAALLADGADPKGTAIRELDDAYIRIRDEQELSRELAPYLTATLDLQLDRVVRVSLGPSNPAGSDGSHASPLHVIPIMPDADLDEVLDVIGMSDPSEPAGHPARVELPDGSQIDAYAIPRGGLDDVRRWARAFRAPLVYSWEGKRLVALRPDRGWSRELEWTTTVSPGSALDDRLASFLASRKVAAERQAQEARRLEEERAADARRLKEERAADARREAAERSALLTAGWPADWTTEQLQGLAAGGADPAVCNTLAKAGWTPVEVAAVASSLGPGSSPPPGEAQAHRRFGDSLRCLLDGIWPPAPPGTVLSRKDTGLDGSRLRRWFVREDAAGLTLIRCEREPDTTEWVCRSVASAPDLAALASAAEEAFTLAEGLVAIVVTNANRHDETLDVLRFEVDDRPDRSAWPLEAKQAWSTRAAALRRLEPDTVAVGLWWSINDSFILGVGEERPRAVLLEDLDDDGVEPLTTVAYYSWFSEAGGAPVSWDGGNDLVVLAPGTLAARQWGDFGPEFELLEFDGTQPCLVEHIATWAKQARIPLAAALRLEPLDPAGRLSARDRAHWEEMLADLEVTFWLDVPEPVVDEVRRRLRHEEPTYSKIATALAQPLSPEGVTLREALERVAADGVLHHLEAAT